jgi:uncharacterized protein (DUF342 family)
MEAVECQNTNANTNTNTNTNANEMDLVQLNTVRESIENMSKFNQVEVLRILTKHKEVTINENKYGIHINLSEMNNSILDELLIYIKYVNTQEIDLNTIEKQKQDYKNIYFLKDNKDNTSNSINNKYVTDFRS